MKLDQGKLRSVTKSLQERQFGSRVPDLAFLLLRWWGQPNLIDFTHYKQRRAARTRWGLPWRR